MYTHISNHHRLFFIGIMSAALLSTLFFSGCGEDGSSDPKMEATDDYLARKVTYLNFCHDACETGCGLRGIVCRIAKGSSSYNRSAIDDSLQKLADRRDTSDFDAASLVRLIYLDDETQALLPDDRVRIEEALLDFTWWVDQPNQGMMIFGTENHQILFHSSEYLVGQRWPDQVSTNSGKTGTRHMEDVREKLLRWLDLRGRYGFSEWHSNVYFNEDMPALINLAQFANDPEISTKASIVLDIMTLDLLSHTYKGLFATTHGRTYPNKLISGLNDSTDDATWVLLGLGDYNSRDDFTASFLSTSDRYFPVPMLEDLAQEVSGTLEHRQRDSFNLTDGPALGITYTDYDDIMLWTGLGAFLAPLIIDGYLQMSEDLDLWDNSPWGDFPPEIIEFIRSLIGSPLAKSLLEAVSPVSNGMALEEVNTYTYRTPYYQLSGAQDYKPGQWGTQTHIWQATIDRNAYTFVTSPGQLTIDIPYEPAFASEWTGGWYPRATMYRNVGIFQYDAAEVPLIGGYLKRELTHAYWDKSAFDEVIDGTHWIFGRKGQSYLALWSANPAYWSSDPNSPFDRIADGEENTWIVELGSEEENGAFADFVSAIQNADIQADDQGVRYESPSLGLIEVAWEGSMFVAGEAVDIGLYKRLDNPFIQQEHGETTVTVTLGDQRLQLDVTNTIRKLSKVD